LASSNDYEIKKEFKGVVYFARHVRRDKKTIKDEIAVWYKLGQKYYWLIFQIVASGQARELGRGVDKNDRSFWIADQGVYEFLRKLARQCFFKRAKKEENLWLKGIYPDMASPESKKAIFPKARNPAGLTQEKPEPDLFESQENWQGVQRALSHRFYHGRRKDHKLHNGPTNRRKLKPKSGQDYDYLEGEGQTTLF